MLTGDFCHIIQQDGLRFTVRLNAEHPIYKAHFPRYARDARGMPGADSRGTDRAQDRADNEPEIPADRAACGRDNIHLYPAQGTGIPSGDNRQHTDLCTLRHYIFVP